MMRFNQFIVRQSKILLENKQYAIFCAVFFAVLPFASWLSVALVALVTLRKGAKAGSDLLLPALVIHTVPLMLIMPIQSVVFDTLITYLPCYVGAVTLRQTTNWQAVCGVLLLQAFLGALIFQIGAPEIIKDQFAQFIHILSRHPEYQGIGTASGENINRLVWAHLFFGIQILSLVFTTIIPLLFARIIQSKLFIPGGFKKELLAFRSGKLSLLILVVIAIGAYNMNPLALNLLPLMVCYFLCSGFALAYFVFARKKQVSVVILLFLLILLKPSFVLFAYVIIGSLDSIFNFRLYLPARMREST